MRLIRKIKELFRLSERLIFVESEMNELEAKVNQVFESRLKDFEKKIQEMTFAYTKNLHDTKSDYLKKYVETRLDCMQGELSRATYQIEQRNSDFEQVMHVLEHIKD